MHVMATEWSRMWASASFVGVLIIIGVPLWWKTTEVFRVALPYDKISSFDTDSHFITTELVVLANDERTASDVAARIEKDFEKWDVIKLKITKHVLPEKLRSTLDTVAEETEAVEEISTIVDLKKHNTFYVVQRTPLFEEVWVGSERVAFFRDARAASTLIKALTQWVYEPSALYGARSEAGDRARQVRFPGGKGYHVVLSVVHPEPGKMAVDFDAAAAVEDYIGSFVDELSELHNFTLKSQWLYLLDFDFQPKKIMDNTPLGYHHAIRHDRLHLLMTRLEERAATHVSDLPAINLALYIVPCEIAPVVIYDADNKKVNAPVQAFMSPKWGGVVLGAQECGDKPFVPNVPLVMGTFLAQLRNLIGITDKEAIGGAHLEPLRSVSPRAWEVCSLLRVRALEHVTSAERSLRSLAKLLGEISNIVINEEVGASINTAVYNIEHTKKQMAAGDLSDAYKSARNAFLAAETAFMEPSLLALLYFPDDQKYAIYIPLFLPIMFPVILSLKNLVLWFRGKSIKEKSE
ncbi:GPI transamidase component PIG-S isoform X2 [Colias croceus]|uniref:GPI transamidase component PIG-S isoform X2 n=1 Tax=Colias crocea TaxID=72248 RepID=UPI001E2800A6|nr:GPI transamidase component PIG-S isoform X2 [Colias croceus]